MNSSLRPFDDVRAALLAADSVDTALTTEFDVAAGYCWLPSQPERVLRDPDGRLTPVNAGQAVGSVTTARPAALVIEDLCTGAAALLARWARSDLDGVPVQ